MDEHAIIGNRKREYNIEWHAIIGNRKREHSITKVTHIKCILLRDSETGNHFTYSKLDCQCEPMFKLFQQYFHALESPVPFSKEVGFGIRSQVQILAPSVTQGVNLLLWDMILHVN